MNESLSGRVRWSFWLISGLMLLYNVAGVVNFISQMNAESVAALPDDYRVIIEARPGWATASFAVAVFGGSLGCILLLLRNAVARHVFGVSLAGAAVTMIHTLSARGLMENPAGFIVGNLMQLVITLFLIWYAVRAGNRGWIR